MRPSMNPRSVAVAEASARAAASKLLKLFKPWPHVSRDDLVQVAMMGIIQARYDLGKSAFATFTYQVAYRRILDHWDACKCRGVHIHLPADAREPADPRPTSAPGYFAGAIKLLDAADAVPYPRRGQRGRPWREPLRVRLEMMRRRGAGESFGSIALRYHCPRYRVQQCIQSVAKFQRRIDEVAVSAE
jgi:hypothetical protein